MDTVNIEGVIITPLKRIYHPQGDIYHGMKKSDSGYTGFGEVYFSTIMYNEIKGWKKHIEMTLNLIVILGQIEFYIYDNRQKSTTSNVLQKVILSPKNYYRLTIPPELWMAFKGIDKNINMLTNIANMEHRPEEIERIELNEFFINPFNSQ